MSIKLKTKKSIAKRVKLTATGKWKFKHAFKSHLSQNKTTKQKRHLKKSAVMNHSDVKMLARTLPYRNKFN